MKHNIYRKHLWIILLALLPSMRGEASYYGRLTSGGFFSKEVFRNSSTDRYNDVAVLSERLYVNFDKIAESTNEFTVDIRDKNNFFDKMDKERLILTSKNKLQVQQLNLHTTDTKQGLYYSAGRFPIGEAGGVFVDGADIGLRRVLFGLNAKMSIFGGLNPQIIESEKFSIDANSKALGGYLVLENKTQDWGRYLYSTTALVSQTYASSVDRFYLFNNTMTQSENGNNFSSLLYLDMVPKIYLQNLWATYFYGLKNNFKLRSSFSTIDTLHYIRVEDVRETLPASRYTQGAISLRSPTEGNIVSYETKLTAGVRDVDSKNIQELKFGAYFPKLIKDEFSGNLNAGIKKNFTTKDLFFGGGIIHSDRNREIALNQDVRFEKRPTGVMNMAFITEGSYTKFFSRSLFGILSVQNTWDSDVSIFSILFKISYRFGEGGQAPVRDGSPPMGQL